MKSIFFLLISIFLIFLVSADTRVDDSLCGYMGDAECNQGYIPACFRDNEGDLYYTCIWDESQDCSNDPSSNLDCSSYCSTNGYIYDYGSQRCCPSGVPYWHTNSRCYYYPHSTTNFYSPYTGALTPQITSDNYYTRRSSCYIEFIMPNGNYFGPPPTFFECEGLKGVTCKKTEDWIWNLKKVLTLGKCGVTCLTDSNCPSDKKINEICVGTYLVYNIEESYCFNYQCSSKIIQQNQGSILNKCGVECLNDGDCPVDDVSDKFCSGNNIMETRIDNSCFTNYQCTYSTQDIILETCFFKCEEISGEGAICIDKICNEGEKMCSDKENALICQDNQWELKEECGTGCEEGKCKSFYTTNTFYVIVGASIVLIILIILIVVFISKKGRKRRKR